MNKVFFIALTVTSLASFTCEATFIADDIYTVNSSGQVCVDY